MKIISPSFEILSPVDRAALGLVELAGRTCYKSEDKITAESAGPFVSKICNTFKHESVIEHSLLTVKFICDRGVSHELVRHRLCAFSQESTRYCNYSRDKFGREITVIKPLFFEPDSPKYNAWGNAMQAAENAYFALIDLGASPQEARSVLPNSLKTEIVVSANWREWRHIFRLRTSDKAHPQMREIMRPLHEQMAAALPEIFAEVKAA
jgi:thymidylate synthase (FAD)